MVEVDRSEIRQLVRDLRAEATNYDRQLYNWLGVASGGGAVAILSFAANLPDPDFALHALLPTISTFATGVLFSGLAIFSASRRFAASEEHHGAAFTRDELRDAIDRIPVMISAPASIAESANAPRDRLIKQYDEHHNLAEVSWSTHVRWRWTNRLCLACAVIGFLVGLALPLLYIANGGNLVPNSAVATAAPASAVKAGDGNSLGKAHNETR